MSDKLKLKKLELNREGVKELLKSDETLEMCREYAERVQLAAGDGYEMENRSYPERSGAAVFPVTEEAGMDNLRNNTLLKALGGA